MKSNIPIINGLVLAGGKSKRIGIDKSAIKWHGKEQQYYLADLLKPLCAEVFISKREEQKTEKYKILVDEYTGIGQYGAILTAFRFQSDTAWLVVACDLPLIDLETLSFLAKNRSADKMATAFHSPDNGLPEPLIAIWEPKSYKILQDYLTNGYTCPRKVLIKENDALLLQPPNPDAVFNMNTPEDFEKVKNLISKNLSVHHA